MKEIKRKNIRMYTRDNGDCPIIIWLESLDPTVRHRIKSRLTRVTLGNYGEYKVLGDGIKELKFKFGTGYRIYFSEINGTIVLLLCAGDKKTQSGILNLLKFT